MAKPKVYAASFLVKSNVSLSIIQHICILNCIQFSPYCVVQRLSAHSFTFVHLHSGFKSNHEDAIDVQTFVFNSRAFINILHLYSD